MSNLPIHRFPPVRVDKLDPGHQIVYASSCSFGLGITITVLAVLFLILGIAELCIPHFPTAGAILFLPFVLAVAGIFGTLAGKVLKLSFINGVLISGTIAAILCGGGFVAMVTRILIVILIIPMVESEGSSGDWNKVNYEATGAIFAVETFLLLVAFVLTIIEAACACRTTCCGVKVHPTVMIQQPDGSLAEAAIVYTTGAQQASHAQQAQQAVQAQQAMQAQHGTQQKMNDKPPPYEQ